jgi:phosphomannomutase
MGAGYSRMNPVTVLQCTQGIVAYLEKTNDLEKLKRDGVVIGYDHRDDKAGINSEMMARAGETARYCVLCIADWRV